MCRPTLVRRERKVVMEGNDKVNGSVHCLMLLCFLRFYVFYHFHFCYFIDCQFSGQPSLSGNLKINKYNDDDDIGHKIKAVNQVHWSFRNAVHQLYVRPTYIIMTRVYNFQ